MRTKSASAVLVCTAIAISAVVTAQQPPVTVPVIVVFNENTPFAAFAGQYRPDERAVANPDAWAYQDRGVAGALQNLEQRHAFRADRLFSATIRGFSGQLTARQIADLESDPMVSYVELDGTMSIVQRPGPTPPPAPGPRPGGGGGTPTPQVLPWGIDKIDADLSSAHAGDGSGVVSNVNVYIIDTGIYSTHQDLNVVAHVNFAGGSNADCNGHGTHVAGTVAARDNTGDVVGVVPGAPLTGVKVLGCNGSGSTSGVIAGIDWVTANAAGLAIANMSLGGGASTALDNAVKNSAASGVFYSIAAGNDGVDACSQSPARAGAGTDNGIMTTAATDSANKEASWSNFGACVDIWAPGVSVLSTKLNGGTTTFSGTSMAAPHVGGGGALYLAGIPGGATPIVVESILRSFAASTGTTSKDGKPIKLLNVAPF